MRDVHVSLVGGTDDNNGDDRNCSDKVGDDSLDDCEDGDSNVEDLNDDSSGDEERPQLQEVMTYENDGAKPKPPPHQE